ncbi:hypothetical protein [Melissospora conviva]|uniref:hypothetical protein n=1 Tax=Melissospora conviva TaxID=3388432 RepID=UPI003C29F2C6
MTQQELDLNRVTLGMPVIDAAGTEVGAVDMIRPGDPNAVTVQPPDHHPSPALDHLEEAIDTAEPAVPADLAARLLRVGFLRVATGPGPHPAVYVQADQIAAVGPDGVRLRVLAAQLPTQD